jgi:hypothetical protein
MPEFSLAKGGGNLRPSFYEVVDLGTMTFTECRSLASRWKNSSLPIVRDSATNDAVLQVLRQENVARAWLGAATVVSTPRPSTAAPAGPPPATVSLSPTYQWVDGTNLSFTNWAANHPSPTIAVGAITLDNFTGKWLSTAQDSTLAFCVLHVPTRMITMTQELPEFQFPPAPPMPTVISTASKQKTVVFALLGVVLLVGVVIALAFHFKTPSKLKTHYDGPVVFPPVKGRGGEEQGVESGKGTGPKDAPVEAGKDSNSPPVLPLNDIVLYNDVHDVEATMLEQRAAREGRWAPPMDSTVAPVIAVTDGANSPGAPSNPNPIANGVPPPGISVTPAPMPPSATYLQPPVPHWA